MAIDTMPADQIKLPSHVQGIVYDVTCTECKIDLDLKLQYRNESNASYANVNRVEYLYL